ncbi:hypothetical protein TNCV_1293621 [Trichonephila clavipes]|nr:hypothetical protein TNCV_1293621 [Trichonephila clavipes]
MKRSLKRKRFRDVEGVKEKHPIALNNILPQEFQNCFEFSFYHFCRHIHKTNDNLEETMNKKNCYIVNKYRQNEFSRESRLLCETQARSSEVTSMDGFCDWLTDD